MCWVHEGRHYKKLKPIFKKHKRATKNFINQFWDYYQELLQYKQAPSEALAKQLKERFDALFSIKTGYDKLDQQIERTLQKSEALLLVLTHPFMPLHNNRAENMARYQARFRDIHLHTMSETGTEAKDTLATLTGTARKLMVNVFDYFYDRITRCLSIKSLADQITIQAAKLDSS